MSNINDQMIAEAKQWGNSHDALRQGADAKHKDAEGNTALHYAVRQKNFNGLNDFIQAGGSMTEANTGGFTPLNLLMTDIQNRILNVDDTTKKHIMFEVPAIIESVADSMQNRINTLEAELEKARSEPVVEATAEKPSWAGRMESKTFSNNIGSEGRS